MANPKCPVCGHVHIGIQMIRETLDDVAAAVGYVPDHDKQFSGDRLVEIVRKLVSERDAAQLLLSQSLGV